MKARVPSAGGIGPALAGGLGGRPAISRLSSGQAFVIEGAGEFLRRLVDHGMIETSAGEGRALHPIVIFNGLCLKCDPLELLMRERVFPLHDDESLLLAAWSCAQKGERVLEIGAGAGVASLCMAAAGADRVVAADINPRVKDCFLFNAELNGLKHKVEYVDSDVFSGLGTERFDVIAANPPFVPVPGEADYFLHSDGGPFGTEVLERIARGWKAHLRPAGRLYALALSLGGLNHWRLNEVFPEAKSAPIYREGPLELARFTDRFRKLPGYGDWKVSLAARGYDRMDYFGLAAGDGAAERLRRLKVAAEDLRAQASPTSWGKYSWSMTARLNRYAGVPA